MSDVPTTPAAPVQPLTVTHVTVDVQKLSLYWVAREWRQRVGDSLGPRWDRTRLLEWGQVTTFDEIAAIADKVRAYHVLVDSGYGERTMEVYEACWSKNFRPTKGTDRKMLTPWARSDINPFEGDRSGRQRQQAILPLIQVQTDHYKQRLLALIRGETPGITWEVYQGIDREYVAQVASEERVDGKWRLKRGVRDNHLWDCEVLQVVASDLP